MEVKKPAKLVMRKMSELRQFSEAEVQAVIDYTKTNHPDVWAEIERIERTTGLFTGTDVESLERRIVTKLHPECDLADLTNLGFAVRSLRRRQFGLNS